MPSSAVYLLLCVALAAVCQLASADVLSSVLTQRDTSDRLAPQDPIAFTGEFHNDAATLSFYPHQRYQSILGFGGAFTEAAASNLNHLPMDLQEEIINAYYNKSTGHGYNWGRIPMGSCDFSLSSYSYNDVVDDFKMVHFDKNATRDQQTIIPFIHRASAAAGEKLRLFATPWSPPFWMKTNNNMNGTSSPCIKVDDQDRYHKAWALYFLNWIQTYESFGIPIWSPAELQTRTNCCLYTSPYQEMEFLSKHLYPTVHPVMPHLNFLFWDHNKDHMVAYANAFYSNATLRGMVWGIALHWYTGDSFSNVQQVFDAWPSKGIMATEACDCPINIDRWQTGEHYGHDILGDLNAGVQGWTDWNLILDWTGGPDHIGGESCDAPVIRLENNTLHYQPAYYYLGHFSRFLPRAAVRIMHQYTDSDSTLEITTWLAHVGSGSADSGLKQSVLSRTQRTGQAPSGWEVVVVVLNREDEADSIQVTSGWYTTGSVQAVVSVPPHSIRTMHFDAALLNVTAPPPAEVRQRKSMEQEEFKLQ